MLTIDTTRHDTDTLILSLQGDLTIETVADLREALLSAYGEDQPQVRLNGGELTNIDFFGLQLLCSAHRTAVKRNKLFVWDGGRPQQISEAMRTTGFTRHCGCALCPQNVDCMWL